MDLARLGRRTARRWRHLGQLKDSLLKLDNGLEVFRAHRSKRPLPPFRLRGGAVVEHRPVDPAWFIFNEIFIERCYTRRGFYRPEPGHTVVDIGANIGFFAFHLEQVAPGIGVHCFEPWPETVAQLERNVAANGLGGKVHIHPLAVSDREGSLTLNQPRGTAGSVSIVYSAEPAGPVASVPCVGLARALALCGDGPIDLLKLDIEGSELEALEGAPDEAFARIQRVVLETHEAYRPGSVERVLSRLRRVFPHVLARPMIPGFGYAEAWR